ncbi:MAG: hypothetical protein MJK04_01550, partial [Psychrosphaera sp.]|nr:hypothetical protein [Psychrosphaera sp.]
QNQVLPDVERSNEPSVLSGVCKENGTDEQGFVWATVGGQLLKIDPKNDATELYNTATGMPITEFTNTAINTGSNTLLFGGNNGLLSFEPQQLPSPAKNPKVSLSDLQIKRTDSSTNAPAIWARVFNKLGEPFVLEKKDNSVRLSFSVLNFAQNANLLYRYKLNNYDSSWHLSEPNMSQAAYTKLPKGDYRFDVSVSTDGRQWGPTQSIAVVQIKPDWFETVWAQALYVIAVILLLRFIYRLRVSQLKQQAVVLNATIEHRTSEIQSLLEQRTRFFAFVSHELKTPLTLVQDPLNRLA